MEPSAAPGELPAKGLAPRGVASRGRGHGAEHMPGDRTGKTGINYIITLSDLHTERRKARSTGEPRWDKPERDDQRLDGSLRALFGPNVCSYFQNFFVADKNCSLIWSYIWISLFSECIPDI